MAALLRYAAEGALNAFVASRLWWRGTLAGGLLLLAAVCCGEAMVEACLPLFHKTFSVLASEFNVVSIVLDREGADRVVRATVSLRSPLVIDGRVFFPDPRGIANASTLIAHALQGPVVMLAIALAWPASRLVEHACRVLLLAPLLLALLALDVPSVLAGELWRTVVDALAPGSTSALLGWKSFMQAGGRYALASAGAIVAVQGARWLMRRQLPDGQGSAASTT